ncbi:hypothetical protein F4774DRAFT_342965 [Daldinia eschscholtzii]|nr:hypothetical protein F4774DRAFT_342965 [Daldinia eschscholtzii]
MVPPLHLDAIAMSYSPEQTLGGSTSNESIPESHSPRQGPSSLPLLNRNQSTDSQRPHDSSLEDNKPGQSNNAYGSAWLRIFRAWKFQLLASLVCSSSLVGLAIIAANFSEHPLSDWPLAFISINGIVAILTALLKGPLMVLIADSISQAKWLWFTREGQAGRQLIDLELIDNASRGPWGSFIWLYNYPLGLHFISFGALLTTLVVGVDVFSQLLITTEGRAVIDTQQTAHISWVIDTYSPIDNPTWVAAVNNGIYSSVVDDLPIHCPSGNCTWDSVVPSVGVCGGCENITQMLPKTWISCSDLLCNYTINQGHAPDVINGPRPNSIWQDDDLDRIFPPDVRLEYNIPLSQVITILDTNNSIGVYADWSENGHISIGEFVVFDIPMDYPMYYPMYSFGEPTVTKCSFWYCMQAFAASVQSGQSRQTMATTENVSYMTYWNSTDPAMRQDTNTIPPMGGIFSDIPGFNMKGRNFSAGPLYFYYPEVGHHLSSINSVMHATPARQLTTRRQNPDGSPASGGRFELNDPTFFQVWNYTANDRLAWANKIAKSLTNVIRLQTHPSYENDTYAGNVWIKRTYIKVSWPWIAYPITILLATLFLFAGNIYRTLSTNQRVWGTGMLAILMSDIDKSIKDLARDSDHSNDELIKATGHAIVRLEEDESGWAFRHKKDSE